MKPTKIWQAFTVFVFCLSPLPVISQNVYGRVINGGAQDDSRGVPGVVVTIHDRLGKILHIGLTNDDGYYSIRLRETAKSATYDKIGYLNRRTTRQIEPAKRLQDAVVLVKEGESSAYYGVVAERFNKIVEAASKSEHEPKYRNRAEQYATLIAAMNSNDKKFVAPMLSSRAKLELHSAEIQQRIMAHVPGTTNVKVQVDSKSGTISIFGEAKTLEAKDLAEKFAYDFSDGRPVKNTILINESTSPFPVTENNRAILKSRQDNKADPFSALK
jgi:hypothetical protein